MFDSRTREDSVLFMSEYLGGIALRLLLGHKTHANIL